MKKLAVVVTFVLLAGCMGGQDGPSLAEKNPKPVLDVSGMALEDACSVLGRRDYHGGVQEVVRDIQAEPKTVLRVMGESVPGSKGGVGQVIMLQVAGPVSIKQLPENCVSRIPGSF